jgi:hypothetical protein
VVAAGVRRDGFPSSAPVAVWDHLPASALPRGLCTCDALAWSAGGRRPHDPATCVKYSRVVPDLLSQMVYVTAEGARELRALYGPPPGAV